MNDARVLGTCYVCRRLVWGHVLRPGRPYATSTKTRYAVEDERGIRHSTCWQSVEDVPTRKGIA
jgi:hypothetical protein